MSEITEFEVIREINKFDNDDHKSSNYTLDQVCRTCAIIFDKNSKYFPIFMLDEELNEYQASILNDFDDYYEIVNELISLDLMIEKDDNLPQQICAKCFQELLNFHRFRKLSEKSQITLKTYFFNQEKHLEIETSFDMTIDDLESGYDFLENAENDLINGIGTEEIDESHVGINTDNEFSDSNNNGDISENTDKQSEEILIDNYDENNEDMGFISLPSIIKCKKCNKFSYSMKHKRFCNTLIENDKGNIADETSYICFYCDKAFKSEFSIKDHILEIHSLIEPFTCSICMQTFRNISERSIHMKCHNDNDAFSSDKDKTSQQNNDLQKHEIESQSEETYECKKCSKSFTSSTRYTFHMKLIHGSTNSYECRYCEKSFSFPSHVKKHESRVHTKENPYKCDECNESFKLNAEYKNHMQLHGGKKFICDICGKVFSIKASFNNHQLTHSDTPSFRCEYCGKYFKFPSTLYTHRLIHINKDKKKETHYKCPICSREFSLPSSFEKHMKIHNEGWEYWCKECGKPYKQSKQLTAHMDRIHLKKYWECRYCQKKFTDFSIKDLHLKSHENDTYSCSYCKKTFRKQSYLRIHERIHTGKKPCECLICGKRFLSYDFARHQRKHTKEEHIKAQEKILANQTTTTTADQI